MSNKLSLNVMRAFSPCTISGNKNYLDTLAQRFQKSVANSDFDAGEKILNEAIGLHSDFEDNGKSIKQALAVERVLVNQS